MWCGAVSMNKGFVRQPQEFLAWEMGGRSGGVEVGMEVCSRRIWMVWCGAVSTNKGFARRPQEFLAWEMGGRSGGVEVGMEVCRSPS